MALGGLLDDGDPADIYGDLFTDKQKAALKKRELSQGLFRMSAALAEAAKPSPVPLGIGGLAASLGKGLGAFGSGNDEAADRALKGMQIGEQVKKLRADRALDAQIAPFFMQLLAKEKQLGLPPGTLTRGVPGGGGGGTPGGGGGGSSSYPGGPGAGPPAAAPPPTTTDDLFMGGSRRGTPDNVLDFPSGDDFPSGAAPPPAPAEPPKQTGLLPPPDQLAGTPQGQDIWAQLASFQQGGGAQGGPPFDPAFDPTAPGPDGLERRVNVRPLSGTALPADLAWLKANAPDVVKGPNSPVPHGWRYDDPTVAPRPEDLWQNAPPGGWKPGGAPVVKDPALVALARNYDAASNEGDQEANRLSQLMKVQTVAKPAPAGGGGRAGVVEFWRGQGAPQHVAEGIADRVATESRFDPRAMGDSGTSGGLYQHHADRLTRLQEFAISQNKPWTDPSVQNEFAAMEVKGGDAIAARGWPSILAAPTREAAAKLWDQSFERSAAGPGAGGGGRVNVRPLGGEAVPAGEGATPSGKIPGLDISPQGLAALNALTKMAGHGDVFGSLLETYYKSPAYLEEKARIEKTAEKQVGLEYDPQIAAATAKATQQYIQENDANKTRLEIAKELLTKGGLVQKPDGSFEQIRTITDALAAVDIAKERFKSDREITSVTLTLPGATQPTEMQMTGAQAREVLAGRPVPELGIPAMTGIKIGKPVSSEEDKAGAQARGAAQGEMYKSGLKALDTAHEAVRGANQRAPYYGTMLAAAEGFKPGATAEMRLTAMQYLRDANIIKGDSVPQGEALKLAGERLAFLAVPPNQGSWSNIERQSLKSSIPGMATTPEGLAEAIKLMQQLDDYDRKVSTIHRQVADKNGGLPNILEAQRQIEALGPPLTAQQEAALAKLQQPPQAPPAVGEERRGYRFNGGNPNDQNNWQKVSP